MPESGGFSPMQVVRRTGTEPFRNGEFLLKQTLLDFWRWSASDLVGNAMRGVLAEYIVASALDLPQTVRVEWDAFDLKTPAGVSIEVKSAAYLQSWDQKAFSRITFGIQPTRAWEAATNDYTGHLRRQADVYVFCLLHHQDKATVDPLDMDQWTFYILPAAVLDERFPAQKSIGLVSLLKLDAICASYQELAVKIVGLDLSERTV